MNENIGDELDNRKVIFVTVGTTSFDGLLRAVDSRRFHEAALKEGFSSLIIQRGSGKHSVEFGITRSEKTMMLTSVYRYKRSLAEDFLRADVVICHGGAGCLLEALRLKKPVLAVPNSSLMADHQQELTTALAKEKFIIKAESDDPRGVIDKFEELCKTNLKQLPSGDSSAFWKLVEKEVAPLQDSWGDCFRRLLKFTT